MTDNDIIKALECCNVETDCKRCPLYKEHSAHCVDIAHKNALDFITRQQAEIERLKDGCSNCCVLRAKSETISELNEQIEYWQRGYNDLLQEIKGVKSEAVKEFAENIVEKVEKARQKYQRLCAEQGNKEDEAMNIHFRGMINIVKEMVGENNG